MQRSMSQLSSGSLRTRAGLFAALWACAISCSQGPEQVSPQDTAAGFDAGAIQDAGLTGVDGEADAFARADTAGYRADARLPDRQRLDTGMAADALIADAAASDLRAPLDAGSVRDDGGENSCYPAPFTPPELSRGLRWVRANPMFVSSLAVSMGEPPAEFVHNYFDSFGANAAHLWADALPEETAAWALAGRSDFRFVAWLDHAGRSAANGLLLGGVQPDERRIGYQIGDEPGQTCTDSSYECALSQLQEMSAGVDAVRALDPDALIYVNFNNHRELVDLLQYYGDNVDGDVFSYDRYNRGWGEYETMEHIRTAALAHGKPYWRYLEAFYGMNDPAPTLTESDMRWTAYMGLLYGFTGHTWFIYSVNQNHAIRPALFVEEDSFTAQPTQAWQYAAQLNLELRHLGPVVTQLTSTDVRYLPAIALALPLGTRRWTQGAGDDPFLVDVAVQEGNFVDVSLGFFRDDAGEHYLMVQNVSHKNGEFPTNLGGQGTIRLTFDFACAGGAVDDSRVLRLSAVSGVVEELALTAAGATKILDLVLPGGDGVLLKYNSGRGFAGMAP